jgi:iron complex transport system permease protein
MVSPDLLGVSAGAGFGAAIALLNQGTWWQVQSTALVFGITAVVAAYLIAKVFGGNNITVLVLSGVVISSFFQSLLSIVKTLADTDSTLASITFWLMGSLGRVANSDVLVMLPATMISLALLFLFRHKINALAAGEDEALTMGVNVQLTKLVVIVASTLITVCSVSVCGIIGWIGMVVPHIARMFVGASYSKLSGASFLTGGIMLLMIDNIVRGIPGAELPLGVLTSLIGTPIFVALLSKARKAWS